MFSKRISPFSEEELERTSNPDYWLDKDASRRIYPGKGEDLIQLLRNELDIFGLAFDEVALSLSASGSVIAHSSHDLKKVLMLEKSSNFLKLALLDFFAQKNKNPTEKQHLFEPKYKEVSSRYDPNEDFVDPPVETSSIKIRITEIIDDPDFD